MDTSCAWCGEPWEVYGLRHDGWEYINHNQASELGIAGPSLDAYHDGSTEARRVVSQHVYVAVMEGKGCPSADCGFAHGPGDGPYREEQIGEMVFDSVTDDDPAMFL